MRRIARRDSTTRTATGLPRIGKKRIRASGGGSTATCVMRSSSVFQVFSSSAG